MPKYNYLFTKNQQKKAIWANKSDIPYVDAKKDYWGSLYTKEWKDNSFINDDDIKNFVEEDDKFQVIPFESRRTSSLTKNSWLANNEPSLASEVETKVLHSQEFQKYLASEYKLNFIDKKIEKLSEEITHGKVQIATRQEQINAIKRGDVYPPTNFLTRSFRILNFKAVWNKLKLEKANYDQRKVIKQKEELFGRAVITRDFIREGSTAYEKENQAFFDKLDNAHKNFQQQTKAQNTQAPVVELKQPTPQPQVTVSSTFASSIPTTKIEVPAPAPKIV